MSDTIYRDDAVKAVCKGCLKENPHCRHHWDCPMLTNLGKLPSADRPRERWVDRYGHPTKALFSVYCSRCEAWSEYRSDFCPNCGADMKGADDE